MGVLPGEKLMVLRNDINGPLVLEVKGTRVAIGRGLCQKVMVSRGNVESKE
jgi:ferrous iron transport protein A